MIERKNIPFSDIDIKSSQDGRATITVAIASIGNLDSYNDIIEKGAFSKTIQESSSNGLKRFKHLVDHNPTKLAGLPSKLWIEGNQLLMKSTLFSTALGNEIAILYKEGGITEHSIGYETVKSEDSNEGIRYLKEVKLWEGSTLHAWGANSNTGVISGVKSSPFEVAMKISELSNLLKINGLTDSLYKHWEDLRNELEVKLNASTVEPHTSTIQPQDDFTTQFDDIFKKHKF